MNDVREIYKRDIPWNSSIELLTCCNLNCIHCYLPTHTSMGMNTDEVYGLLRQLREMGAFSVILTGGEILLRDDLWEIIKYARNIGFSVSLFSNATLKMGESELNFLDKINVHIFSTTIFSMVSSIHDSITRKCGSLEKTLENIIQLKRHNIPVEVKIPIMKCNFDVYKDVIKFCQENTLLYRVEPNISIRNNGDATPKKLRIDSKELLEIIQENYKKEDLKRKIELEDYMCKSLHMGLHITYEGDVYPCIGFPKTMGNIREKKISEIWYGEEYKKLRNLRIVDYPRCRDCEQIEFCTLCPANIFMEADESTGCSPNNDSLGTARRTAYVGR